MNSNKQIILGDSSLPDLAYNTSYYHSFQDPRQIINQEDPSVMMGNGNGDDPVRIRPSSSKILQHQQGPTDNPQLAQGEVIMSKNGRPISIVSIADVNKLSKARFNWESFLFWILLSVLIILVIINAVLTIVVFSVLRMGIGMESIEVLPSSALKFFGLVDLDDLMKYDGLFEGIENEPMEISGEAGGTIEFAINEGSQPSMVISGNLINISRVNEFRIVDKDGNEIFSTNKPTLGLPDGLSSLDIKVARVNKITSAINETLTLRTATYLYLKGSEGTHMEGRQIIMAADQDIYLKSVNGDIIMSGREGILLDVNALPLVRESGVTRKSYTYQTQGKRVSQYQLCICMPEGKLFKIQIPMDNNNRPKYQRVGCHSAKNQCKY